MPKSSSEDNNGSSPFETMVEGSTTTSVAEIAEDSTPMVATTWLQEPTFEADEVSFPRLRLGQGLTQEVAEGNAKMGQWLLSGYDPLDEITVIPLMVGRTRFKRKNPADRESPVGCQSPDGVQGYGDPGIACKGCPEAKWRPGGPNGKNLAPNCTLTYRYAVFVAEHSTIAEVSFQRTSESYAHFINNLVQRFKFGNFAVKLSSKVIATGSRRWAEPQVKVAPITPAMRAAAGALIPGNEATWEAEAPDDAEVIDAASVPF